MIDKGIDMNVYTHGVGSSCHGDQYHHEVFHLVVGGITLCGVNIKGRDWWIEKSITPRQFTIERRSSHIYSGDTIICQRCARKNMEAR